MKNLALTTLIGFCMGLATVSATAREYDRERQNPNDLRIGMTWPWGRSLKEEVNHLNRMRGHVRWQLRNYKGNREIRSDFYRISKEIDEINRRFQSGSFNRGRLRADVNRAHTELHRIEMALKVKVRDFYPWR